MGHSRRRLIPVVASLSLLISALAYAQPARAVRKVPGAPSGASVLQKDTTEQRQMAKAEDVARMIDSLQFIVVYNAELLQQDFEKKVIWVYVMLGVMIVGIMVVYGALTQSQRQRKQLAEDLYGKTLNELAEIEGRVKNLEADASAPKPPAKRAPRRRKSRR
jgi:hypothetical protein